MRYKQIEEIFPKQGLRISLGPTELEELNRHDFVRTLGASVEITNHGFAPSALIVKNDKGIDFAIKLPSGTKTPFPDPGHESVMAKIADNRIVPLNAESRSRSERLLGPRVGGIILVAHGAFDDPETLKGNA